MAILRLFIAVVAFLLLNVREEVHCQSASHKEAFARINPNVLRALQTFRGRQRPSERQPDLSGEADVKFEQALPSLSAGTANAREAAGVSAPERTTTLTTITTPGFPMIEPRSQRIDPIVVPDRRPQGNIVEIPRAPVRAQEPQQQQTGPIRSSPLGNQNVAPIDSPKGLVQTMESIQGSSDNTVLSPIHQHNFVPIDSSRVPFRAPEPELRVPDVRTQQQSLPFDSAESVPSRRNVPRQSPLRPLVPASSKPQFLPFDSPRIPLRAREPETFVPVPSQVQDVLTSSQKAFDRARVINNEIAPSQLPSDVATEQPTALIWDHPPQRNYIFLRKIIVRNYRVSPCPGVAFGCLYMEPVLNILYIPVGMA